MTDGKMRDVPLWWWWLNLINHLYSLLQKKKIEEKKIKTFWVFDRPGSVYVCIYDWSVCVINIIFLNNFPLTSFYPGFNNTCVYSWNLRYRKNVTKNFYLLLHYSGIFVKDFFVGKLFLLLLLVIVPQLLHIIWGSENCNNHDWVMFRGGRRMLFCFLLNLN